MPTFFSTAHKIRWESLCVQHALSWLAIHIRYDFYACARFYSANGKIVVVSIRLFVCFNAGIMPKHIHDEFIYSFTYKCRSQFSTHTYEFNWNAQRLGVLYRNSSSSTNNYCLWKLKNILRKYFSSSFYEHKMHNSNICLHDSPKIIWHMERGIAKAQQIPFFMCNNYISHLQFYCISYSRVMEYNHLSVT